MSAPPGWYPNPEHPSTSRWWDGAQWTAATEPAVPLAVGRRATVVGLVGAAAVAVGSALPWARLRAAGHATSVVHGVGHDGSWTLAGALACIICLVRSLRRGPTTGRTAAVLVVSLVIAIVAAADAWRVATLAPDPRIDAHASIGEGLVVVVVGALTTTVAAGVARVACGRVDPARGSLASGRAGSPAR